jgi:hypothetical protein
MSRKTAFDAFLSGVNGEIRQYLDGHAAVREYLEKAPPKDLARLAATTRETLEFFYTHPDAAALLPGRPPADVLRFLAAAPVVRAFLQNIPASPPHIASAQSKVDQSQAAVNSWFNDWKGHSTGILDVHKGILDGTYATGGDMFAALARETIALYATAFHWMLRPYAKKKKPG